MQSRTMLTEGRKYDWRGFEGDPHADMGAIFVDTPIGSYDDMWFGGSYIYPHYIEGMGSQSTYAWLVIILIIILLVVLWAKRSEHH
jgi:hypothetical protein